MPQDFINPSVGSSSSNAATTTSERTFDELRRDVEQGFAVLDVAVQRTRQSGPDEQAEWAIKRVRTTIDKMRRVPAGDSFVVNRLTADFSRRETELRSAEKAWLLANKQSAVTVVSSNNHNRSEDDDRATVLRANQTISDSHRVLSDIEQGLGHATQTGRGNLDMLNSQGQELEMVLNNVEQGGVTAKHAGIVLRRMAERAFYNRMFLWFLVILFFLIDVLFLYYGFIKKD